MAQIEMIRTEEIYSHPDNPRRDMGDISELTESIRKNGVMQNLTVIPGHYMGMEEFTEQYCAAGGKSKDAEQAYKANRELGLGAGGYTVVIGNRRLAAARAAGLSEVPCMVSVMDHRQQMCTMMEENMQRQDLTLTEQAYGFQMMLDLGETVKDIAEKTGFAETTVRHRLEIAKLDPRNVNMTQASDACFQMTINDFIRLEQIKDIKKRNEVIGAATSRADFIRRVEDAVTGERIDRAMEKIMPLLEEAGITKRPKDIYEWSPGVSEVKRIDLDKKPPKSLNLPEFADGTKVFWHVNRYSSELVISKKEKQKKAEKTPGQIEQEARIQKNKQIEAIMSDGINRMREFTGWINEGKIKPDGKSQDEVIKAIWTAAMICNTGFIPSKIYKAHGRESWELSEDEQLEYREGFSQRLLSVQMVTLFGQSLGSYEFPVCRYEGTYNVIAGRKLMAALEMLADIYGFEPDADFLAVANGTHELYKAADN